MNQFRPGDICVIVDAYHHPDNVGRECEFIAWFDRSFIDDDGAIYDCYIEIPGLRAKANDNGWWKANSRHLRKKKPKEDLGSWDEIEKRTGWNPTKVKA